MPKFLSCLAVSLAFLLVGNAGRAQSNASDAALEGYVRDPSGAPISSAIVVARNVATNTSSQASTDDQGYYRFQILKIGPYELTATANGFSKYVQTGLNLVVGQNARSDIAMQVGPKTEAIQVTSDAPLVDSGTAAIGTVLSEREIADLPVISRNIYNFFLLSPGVQGLPSSTFSTTQFTFGGTERSYWTVDGLDNTQKGANRQIRLVITTPDAVEETQVLANGYSAEFGRAAGGQANVILKSGTNQFHGSALYEYRFSDLQARPSLAAVAPPRTWHDESFTLGGPIVRDKLFFFGQYESNPYTLPTPITISAANALALKLPASQTGNSPFGETYRTLVGKANFSLNEKNSGYIRYSRFTNDQPNNSGGLFIPNLGASYKDRMNGGGVQLATVFNPNLVNEVRGGVIQRFTSNTPVAPVPGSINAAVTISGVANIGYNPVASASTNEQSNQVLDNITWTHGQNTWKFGMDYEHTAFDNTSALTRTFTFGGLASANGFPAVSPLNQYLNTVAGVINPATSKPYTYTQFSGTAGNPNINLAFNLINFFAQDEWRATPKLTFNVGLRYEAILFPTFNAQAPYALSRKVNNDLSDWAPRFAFTWNPFDNKTVIRGAYGIYYDVPPLSVFYNAAQQNGQTFLSYTIPGTSPLAPAFPNVPDLSQSISANPSNINAFSPGFHNTYQHQANLQIQRELPGSIVLTVGTNFAALRHGLYSRNTNLGAPVSYLADGRPVFGGPRPNPQFNQINLIEAGANSNYNSLFLNISKRLSRSLEIAATYTYSHALSNNLGEGGAPEDPTNLNRDYGNSEDDVRHYMVIQGLYAPTLHASALRWINGFEISSSAFYISGYPINVLTGTDLNNNGVLNDRPLFVGRNSVQGPSIFQLDARLTRSFTIAERYKISAIIESENLLNSTNAACTTSGGCSGAVINTFGAADFGRIVSARTARNVQVGAKFTF